MALLCSISDTDHMVTMRTEGAVTLVDLQVVLNEARRRAAIGYRKLLDAREGHLALLQDELGTFEQESIACAVYGRLGPYAIVASEASRQAFEPLLTLLLSNTRRPSGLFANPTDAYEWLLTHEVMGGGL
jgi:hypothetical protein